MPDHVHVSSRLCPLPKVIEHSKNPSNHDPEDEIVCKWLIKKLMVLVDVVERTESELLEAS